MPLFVIYADRPFVNVRTGRCALRPLRVKQARDSMEAMKIGKGMTAHPIVERLTFDRMDEHSALKFLTDRFRSDCNTLGLTA